MKAVVVAVVELVMHLLRKWYQLEAVMELEIIIVQGLAPNSGQRVLAPNSEHFLCLLLHFSSDSAHTGLNRTGIITYIIQESRMVQFSKFKYPKTRKSPSQISAPVCFLFFETNNFIIFKLKTRTLWDSAISSNSYRSIYLSLG